MTDEQEKALKKAILLMDLALGAWLLWMLLPAQVKLPITTAVAGQVGKARAAKRRRSEERRSEFELYLLRNELVLAGEAMASYDRHRDPDQLAKDLATSL